jgi:hypothetical protein
MLEFVQAEWDKDSIISRDDPNPLSVDQLHAKYFRYLTEARKELIPLDQTLGVLRLKKEQFFLHPLMETQKITNWKAPVGKVLKGEVKYHLNADVDILDLEKKIAMINIRIDFLEDTLKLIHFRGKRIETHIAWEKFKHGIS